MQTNRYPARCVDCKRHTSPGQGFLFGQHNAVACIECVYREYATRHGYLSSRSGGPAVD